MIRYGAGAGRFTAFKVGMQLVHALAGVMGCGQLMM